MSQACTKKKSIATIVVTSTNIQLLVELFDSFDWPEGVLDLVDLSDICMKCSDMKCIGMKCTGMKWLDMK